jgi:amino acid adenylation domain-containing protein
MSEISEFLSKLPPEQQAIRDKCFHPSGTFVEFRQEEVEQSISQRFEKVSRMYPDNIAVKTNNEVVTYSELNAMANRVARSIILELGHFPQTIGILPGSHISLVATSLGVLKTGSCVLLLDPRFPLERIRETIEDSHPALIIADRQTILLTGQIIKIGNRLIEFESINSVTADNNIELEISPTKSAFLIYTSGSTGKPKGVLQNHRSRLHRVMERTNAFHLCEKDNVSLFSSATSNAIGNSLRALMNGASLYTYDVNTQGISQLSRWLSNEKITICSMAASLFREFCGSLTRKEVFPDLRILGLRSESVCRADFELYKSRFPRNCVLANGLSPSEVGLLTMYFLDHDSECPGDDVPVGYPVNGKELLLVDDDGKVGADQVGEIVVRSKYFSAGYWNNPDLTNAKFKPDSDDSEKLIYHTGDLGLMRPDGCLIYKGRKDSRVKIRGHGVEMAEVERALREHSAIKDLFVASRQNESGESYLIAYFVTHGRSAPTAAELRSLMKKKLPDYMIPSKFVHLDALPLTPSDKVDRKALPEPKTSRPDLQVAFTGPTNSVELLLTQIWAEVLSLDKVGLHDNFFDLGGHSLGAFRVITRVIQIFQLELPVKALFDSPTIAEMASVITQNELKPANETELAQMLREVEAMTEEEAGVMAREMVNG